MGALQDCPEFLKHLRTPLAIASESASLKIIFAPFPRNSKLIHLKSIAAFWEINAPALVDPVKEIISISG